MYAGYGTFRRERVNAAKRHIYSYTYNYITAILMCQFLYMDSYNHACGKISYAVFTNGRGGGFNAAM